MHKLRFSIAWLWTAVFVAANATGQIQITGRVHALDGTGLPGVRVSDMVQVTVTDETGAYRLLTDAELTSHIFAVLPTGYRPAAHFPGSFPYHRIPEGATEVELDFALADWPASRQSEFRFAQVTDIHLSVDTQHAENFAQRLQEVMSSRPDFIIDTGDLASDQTKEQLESFRAVLRQVESPPYFPSIGNHDLPEDGYEHHMGPAYYAFDFSDVHFIAFMQHLHSPHYAARSRYTLEQVTTWLEQHLAHVPVDRPIILFQHFPIREWLIDVLADYQVVGTFTGHAHSMQVIEQNGALHVNSPPLRFGGDDGSPPGFRTVDVSGGTLAMRNHLSGVDTHLRFFAPSMDEELPLTEPVRIAVQVQDASGDPEQVEYRMDGGPWTAMQSGHNGWTWTADWDGPTADETPHTVQVRARWSGGREARQETSFSRTANAVRPMVRIGEDWPTFQGNTARTGMATSQVEPPLKRVWSRTLPGRLHIASPILADGLLLVGLSDEEHRGGSGMYALDPATGEVRWHHPTRHVIKSSLEAGNGLVYGATLDDRVYALRAENGELVWSTHLDAGFRDAWNYGAPLLHEGILYVGPPQNFAALETATGDPIWSTRMRPGRKGGHHHPATGDGQLFIPVHYGPGLFAIDRETGTERWNLPWVRTMPSPAYADGRLYYGGDRILTCLNTADGSIEWEIPMGTRWEMSTAAIGDEHLYVGTSDGRVRALHRNDGRELWSFETGPAIVLTFSPRSRGGSAPVVASPVVSGNVVYIGGIDGVFYALDRETGQERWSHDLAAPITSSAAVSGNTVFVATYDGTIHAFTGRTQ